jgi:hypothetical protein
MNWNMQIINGDYKGSNYQYAPFIRVFNKNESGEYHIATVNLISAAYASNPHAGDEKHNNERIANAQLITAAPDLLEALKLARSVIAECRKVIPKSPHDDGVPVEFFINEAINKAEGIS